MKQLKSELEAGASVHDLIIRPHHTALSVEDFEAARIFFTDVIGMRLEREIDYRDESDLGVVVGLPGAVIRWAFLEMGGYRIELFKYYSPAGTRHPMRQCDIGLTHICFQVRDANETYRRLVAAGHKTISAPRELRGGQSVPFYLIGPDEIVVEFLELRS